MLRRRTVDPESRRPSRSLRTHVSARFTSPSPTSTARSTTTSSEIGLAVRERQDGRAALGAGGEDLLVLVEEPGAKPADGFSGLYHFALLVPDRADLARWLAHAARDRVQLVGMSDHFVSEALYLRDPDHHGIEIYADRPRELWEGQVWQRMTSLPLDTTTSSRSSTTPRRRRSTASAQGTVMGHVHLRVSEIALDRRVLRRRARVRADGAARRARGVPQRRWLPPPSRREHRGRAREPGRRRPATRRFATRRSCSRARTAAAALLERAGGAVDEVDGSPVIRDPSGNRLALATA